MWLEQIQAFGHDEVLLRDCEVEISRSRPLRLKPPGPRESSAQSAALWRTCRPRWNLSPINDLRSMGQTPVWAEMPKVYCLARQRPRLFWRGSRAEILFREVT